MTRTQPTTMTPPSSTTAPAAEAGAAMPSTLPTSTTQTEYSGLEKVKNSNLVLSLPTVMIITPTLIFGGFLILFKIFWATMLSIAFTALISLALFAFIAGAFPSVIKTEKPQVPDDNTESSSSTSTSPAADTPASSDEGEQESGVISNDAETMKSSTLEASSSNAHQTRRENAASAFHDYHVQLMKLQMEKRREATRKRTREEEDGEEMREMKRDGWECAGDLEAQKGGD
ncbi:hypothetical protein B0J14DRAFT_25548 [Halenospora varia]|nr:hypothetical protein B0J14DRAFT_25548 [Halenospora varia]